MRKMPRREFIQQTVLGGSAILAANVMEVQAKPLGLPIGCQVWPHRATLNDLPSFLTRMSGIGVTRLELCSPIGYGAQFASLSNGKEVKKVLSDHGFRAESSHFSMSELRQSQEKSLEWAKEIGIKQVITASLGDGNGEDHPTLDQVKKAAEEYNRIAQITAKAGLQQGLHNEGFELSTVDGKRTYDLLFELLDPKLVKFQFQMSTISAGLIAADYFTRYPGRFFSMHVQDVDMKTENHPQVAVGKGSIDWIKTFSTSKIGGVKNYFVEQEWPLTQESVAYLKTLKV